MVSSLLLGVLAASGATALNNGVGKLPALGFNSELTLSVKGVRYQVLTCVQQRGTCISVTTLPTSCLNKPRPWLIMVFSRLDTKYVDSRLGAAKPRFMN